MPTVCFDLEGPLSPQDNAYEVMGLFENGYRIFEVISKYDDILTLEGRKGYEAGDTLKLIVPFLLHHGIAEDDIRGVSAKARLVSGMKETVSHLMGAGWRLHIISTSYHQHAMNIASGLGVPPEDVACTWLPLDRYREGLEDRDFQVLEKMERSILEELYPPVDEEAVKETLDGFFFDRLLETNAGAIFEEVKVTGGQRKVEAMEEFLKLDGTSIERTMAVGDSITDFKMLRRVKEGGGVGVVFNGNEYAIPHGTVGLATTDGRYLLALTSAFEEDGRDGVMEAVRELEGGTGLEELMPLNLNTPKPPVFTLLEGAAEGKVREAVKVHKVYRSLVRGEAGKLG
jgi:energy-converting hydrogenase A subunit R